jgi:hypothetical protein
VAGSFHGGVPGPVWPDEDSHSRWTEILGPRHLQTKAVSRNAFAVSAGVTIDLSDAVALKVKGDAAPDNGINYVGGGWAGLSVKF